jgi:S-adenosylmethionine:diacylglycerol 3-amino-3-carboxypropyl transferase
VLAYRAKAAHGSGYGAWTAPAPTGIAQLAGIRPAIVTTEAVSTNNLARVGKHRFSGLFSSKTSDNNFFSKIKYFRRYSSNHHPAPKLQQGQYHNKTWDETLNLHIFQHMALFIFFLIYFLLF